MMVDAMTRKLIDGARDAVGVAAGVARHVIWYVSYQVDGTARDDDSARKFRSALH
jgi:hypothetical protein